MEAAIAYGTCVVREMTAFISRGVGIPETSISARYVAPKFVKSRRDRSIGRAVGLIWAVLSLKMRIHGNMADVVSKGFEESG